MSLPICPHCGDANVNLILRGSYESAPYYYYMFECKECNRPVCVESLRCISNDAILFNLQDSDRIFPEPEEDEAPYGTPTAIANSYLAALHNMRIDKPGTLEASAIMCRRTIEMTTRHFGSKNGDLCQRIGALVAEGILTKSMGDWAHAIRLLGNAGAHNSNNTTQEDARQALYFTEMLLIYLFKLPKMLEDRKNMGIRKTSD